jgi:hypothetical protein
MMRRITDRGRPQHWLILAVLLLGGCTARLTDTPAPVAATSSAAPTVVDAGVIAYDLNASRDAVYYLKVDQTYAAGFSDVSLWVYRQAEGVSQPIAWRARTTGPHLADLRFLADGRYIVQLNNYSDVHLFDGATLIESYPWRWVFRHLSPDAPSYERDSPAELAKQADYYRQLLARNEKIAIITATSFTTEPIWSGNPSFYTTYTYYLLRDEQGEPILLNEAEDALGQPFRELDPGRFEEWPWLTNPAFEQTADRFIDAANGLEIERSEQGTCTGQVAGGVFSPPKCRIRYSLTFGGQRLKLAERNHEFLLRPSSRQYVAATGELVLVVDGELQFYPKTQP